MGHRKIPPLERSSIPGCIPRLEVKTEFLLPAAHASSLAIRSTNSWPQWNTAKALQVVLGFASIAILSRLEENA